jgi:hypothetical protein
MNSLKIAAQFAAFTWYINVRKAPRRTVEEEARRFARENWEAFLNVANEGLGKLLLRIADRRAAQQRRHQAAKRRTRRALASAV